MHVKVVPVRLVTKTKLFFKTMMKCPIPSEITIPEYDGTITRYIRRFALMSGGEAPKMLEVFFYEDD